MPRNSMDNARKIQEFPGKSQIYFIRITITILVYLLLELLNWLSDKLTHSKFAKGAG